MSTASSETAASSGQRPRISPLLFIFLTIFIDLLGIGLLIPVLPYIVAEYRADASTLGLLSSSYAIAQFLAAPVLGSISDRVGRRPVLLFSMLGTSIGYFVFGSAHALWVLFAARILDGITGGVVGTAQAYIADVSPPEDRAKNFGLIGMAVGLGFIFGPAIGGLLAQYSLNTPVFFSAGFALLNAIFGYFTLPESLKHREEKPLSAGDFNPFRSLVQLFRRVSIRQLVLGFFLFNLAFAGFTNIFALYTKDQFQWGPGKVAGLFFLIGTMLALVQGGLIRKLLPRYGEANLTIWGLALSVLAFLAIPYVPNPAYLYGTQALLAVGVGIATPAIRAIISNRISDKEQGRVIGGTQGLTSLGQVLGPLWASAAYDFVGPKSPFLVAAAVFAFCLVLIVPQVRKS